MPVFLSLVLVDQEGRGGVSKVPRKVVFSGLDGIYSETERMPLKAMISIIPMPMIFDSSCFFIY